MSDIKRRAVNQTVFKTSDKHRQACKKYTSNPDIRERRRIKAKQYYERTKAEQLRKKKERYYRLKREAVEGAETGAGV